MLGAAVELMRLGRAPTVAELAQECRIGRATIYRWWPSKAALMLDAFVHQAELEVGGGAGLALDGFIRITFAAIALPERRAVLRSVAAEALVDSAAMEILTAFTSARRIALREVLVREAGGRLVSTERLELLVDEIFGVLWYRVLFGHGELDAGTARILVDDIRKRLA